MSVGTMHVIGAEAEQKTIRLRIARANIENARQRVAVMQSRVPPDGPSYCNFEVIDIDLVAATVEIEKLIAEAIAA